MNKFHTSRAATSLGMGALFLWAVEPLLVSEMDGLPLFEALSLVFLSSFLITAVRITQKGLWRQVLFQPLHIWLAGFVGICGSDFAYILGAGCAPIAHVDLIDYLWPCFAILFSSLLPREVFKPQYLLGGLVAFLGILTLLIGDSQLLGMNSMHMKGYLLALYGAMLWGGYSAFSRHYKAVPVEMIGMYCGLGFIVCLIFHLVCEQTVIPAASQGFSAVATGLTGAGLAYQLWDFGIKHGNLNFLSVVTYMARILGMVLLVLFGKEPFSIQLVFACVLACLGVYLTSMSSKRWLWLTHWARLNRKTTSNPDDDEKLPVTS